MMAVLQSASEIWEKISPNGGGLFLSNSEWLEEYYSRITEEYKFSMERKDRVLDWSIGIFFIALVAYVELLRYQLPSVWRICLMVGLLCFVIRLFSSSCLAYAYLKKWRYLLDFVEKYWGAEEKSPTLVKNEIERYHYTPRTTEGRLYFVKHQLVGGFFLLFLFPLALLAWDIYSNAQDLRIIVPLSFLVAYCIYEAFIFVRNKELSMPPDDAASNKAETDEEMSETEHREMGMRDRLNLFEGIVIGIYGNWLISLVDRITYTKAPVIFGVVLLYYQPFCLAFSFACLLILFGFSVLRPDQLTRGLVVILSTGHMTANWAVLHFEGFSFKNLFFMVIGILLFLVVYLCELTRMRIRREE